MTNEKDLKDLTSKLLNLYAFSCASSSVNISDISSMKTQNLQTKPDLIHFHYRMVDKSSIENSRKISSQLFKIYFNNILKEIKK